MKTARTNTLVKIPRGWHELRAGTVIRGTDRGLLYNAAPFRVVTPRIVGQTYITHSPGNHWTIIRRNRR